MRDEHSSDIKTSLISRNISIFDKRTSVRLEPEMWASLKDISLREECSIHDICTLIFLRKKKESSLTASIRVFIMLYFKAAATEQGHLSAGHGSFEYMKMRARITDEFDRLESEKRIINDQEAAALELPAIALQKDYKDQRDTTSM